MYTVLIVLQVLLAAALVAVVLVQRGPGATMGAAFGSGASGTVFGARGAAGFLTKLTSWLGVAFFAISLSMAVIVARSGDVGDTAEDLGVAGQLVDPMADSAQGTDDAPADEQGAEQPQASDEEFLEVPVEGEQGEENRSEADEDDEDEQPPAN